MKWLWLATLMACSANQPTSVPSCLEGFTACGGSVIGTWEIQSICVDPERSDKCQAQRSVAYNPGYATTFLADGTYTNPPSSFTRTDTLPASCFAGARGASDCAALASGCSLSIDGSCACSLTVTTFAENQGSYTISGTNLTDTPNGGSPLVYAFCVQGNILTEADTTGGNAAVLTFVKR